MAYTINPGAILEIAIEGTLNGQQFISLFPFKFTDGDPSADGRATAQAVLAVAMGAARLKAKYAACIVDAVNDMHMYAQWIYPIRYAYIAAAGADFGGLIGETAFPQNVAAAITKIGAQANRSNIGTLHMPAVPSTWVIDGLLTPDAVTAYSGLGTEILADIVVETGRTFDQVIYHRVNGSLSAKVEQFQVQPTSRVMRRRTVGVGS